MSELLGDEPDGTTGVEGKAGVCVARGMELKRPDSLPERAGVQTTRPAAASGPGLSRRGPTRSHCWGVAAVYHRGALPFAEIGDECQLASGDLAYYNHVVTERDLR